MTAGYLPRALADRYGDAPAIRDEHTQMTFRELDARVSAVAAQFRDLGVSSGDVVAVMLPNRSELVISIFAAWYLGAAATPDQPTVHRRRGRPPDRGRRRRPRRQRRARLPLRRPPRG